MSSDPAIRPETMLAVLSERLGALNDNVIRLTSEVADLRDSVVELREWRIEQDTRRDAYAWRSPLFIGITVSVVSAILVALITTYILSGGSTP